MTEKRWLTVVEAAKRLDLSEDIVRDMCRTGRIPALRTSERGRYRISVKVIERLEAGT